MFIFTVVTKCHKNAQSHRAPTCAPTPALPRLRSLARSPLPTAPAARLLRAPPQPPHIHTFKSSFKCSTANLFEGKGILPASYGHMSKTVTLVGTCSTTRGPLLLPVISSDFRCPGCAEFSSQSHTLTVAVTVTVTGVPCCVPSPRDWGDVTVTHRFICAECTLFTTLSAILPPI